MSPELSFVCAYLGPHQECSECGGFNDTGTPYCGHDCAADHADRVARMAAREQARRDNEAAYGAEVQRLRAAGHSYEHIDSMLAGWAT